jgi:hypothetical protein
MQLKLIAKTFLFDNLSHHLSLSYWFIINIGSTIDDGTGDLLRNAFNKVNTNFEALWEVTAVNSNVDISGDSIASTGDLTIAPTNN